MVQQHGEISRLEVIPLARAHEYVGLETFVTDWIPVPKDRMDMFEQSIGAVPGETDLSISQANPLGPNLINGVWLIARGITIGFDYMPIREPGMWGFNYGYEKVRFLTPVMVGSRIRYRSILKEVREHPIGRILVSCLTVELEGSDKAAAVITGLALCSTRSEAL
jgi:acyl dehydratase